MKCIVAPEKVWYAHRFGPCVFMCGGITGCKDWQQEFRQLMEGTETGVLLNPRRDKFDVNDPNAAREQITWEFNALWADADAFIFWFTNDTIQPIVLFELGARLACRKFGMEAEIHTGWAYTVPIFIGIEPGYAREQDVRIQTELVDPKIPIVDTLEDLAALLKTHLARYENAKK